MGKTPAQPLDLRRIRLLLRPLRTSLASHSNTVVYESTRGSNLPVRPAAPSKGTLDWSGKGGSKSRAEKDASWADTNETTTRKPSTVTYGKAGQATTPPIAQGLKNTSQAELKRVLLLARPVMSQDLVRKTIAVFEAFKNILHVVYGVPPPKSTPRTTTFPTLQEISARVLGFEIEQAVKSELHRDRRDDASSGGEDSDVYALADEFFVASPVSSWR